MKQASSRHTPLKQRQRRDGCFDVMRLGPILHKIVSWILLLYGTVKPV